MASRERAIRRQQRQADAAARRAAAERREARRRRLWQLRPRLPDRRVGRMQLRRNPAERAGITVLALLAIAMVVFLVPDWPMRIGLIVLILLALPAFVILVLDRR